MKRLIYNTRYALTMIDALEKQLAHLEEVCDETYEKHPKELDNSVEPLFSLWPFSRTEDMKALLEAFVEEVTSVASGPQRAPSHPQERSCP